MRWRERDYLMSKKDEKPKLTYLDLVKHMKSKGIKFEITSEKEAESFLESRNYYFKVTSYRSNFTKKDKKYTNLDFAYLQDLAAIDAGLRRYLTDVTLAVEHGLKVKILDLITKNDVEDGYTIVQEFRSSKPHSYGRVLSYLKSNQYSKDLYKKHHKEPSIWVFLEVATFGDLSQFTEFYFHKYPSKALRRIVANLRFAKNIRNAAAHSNPIIINLFSKNEFIPHPTQALVSEASQMGIDAKLIKDMKIHDLVALFYLHKLLTSSEARSHVSNQGIDKIIARFNKHEEYYAAQPALIQFKNILEQLIDFQLENK